MEIVTIIEVNFNRVGTLLGRNGPYGLIQKNNKCIVVSEKSEDVLQKIQELAISHGESKEAVERLALINNHFKNFMSYYIDQPDEFYTSTRYDLKYAECSIYFALKNNEKYFKLEEIKGI